VQTPHNRLGDKAKFGKLIRQYREERQWSLGEFVILYNNYRTSCTRSRATNLIKSILLTAHDMSKIEKGNMHPLPNIPTTRGLMDTLDIHDGEISRRVLDAKKREEIVIAHGGQFILCEKELSPEDEASTLVYNHFYTLTARVNRGQNSTLYPYINNKKMGSILNIPESKFISIISIICPTISSSPEYQKIKNLLKGRLTELRNTYQKEKPSTRNSDKEAFFNIVIDFKKFADECGFKLELKMGVALKPHSLISLKSKKAFYDNFNECRNRFISNKCKGMPDGDQRHTTFDGFLSKLDEQRAIYCDIQKGKSTRNKSSTTNSKVIDPFLLMPVKKKDT